MVRKIPNKANQSQFERGRTPMDAALGFLSARARTVREVERYLDDQQFGEFEVQNTVDRLQELGYLNDSAYAADFIRTRIATKPVSRTKLQEQMMLHELPRNIVEEALCYVDDTMEKDHAMQIGRKYFRQMSDMDEDERERRVIQRLMGRGFSYDVSKTALNAIQDEDN